MMLAPLLLAGCSKRAQRARPLFAAETHPEGYPTVLALREIDRLLDQRTGGEMRVRVYPGGQLGVEKDTLEITIFGGLDLNRVNLAPLTSIVPEAQVLALPFLFHSVSHARAVFDGDTGQEILDAMTPHGLKGLCYYDSGARSFYNVRNPVRTPEDLKGLKLRVPNSDIYVAMVRALGANPTPIPFTEVYQALVQGVVDGAENNWPAYDSTRHFEVARHFSQTNHVLAPEVLVASSRSWAKLGAEEQDYLHAAARDSVAVMRTHWDARVEAARQHVLASGVQYVDDVDYAAFSALMSPVWDEFLTTAKLRQLSEQIVSAGRSHG